LEKERTSTVVWVTDEIVCLARLHAGKRRQIAQASPILEVFKKLIIEILATQVGVTGSRCGVPNMTQFSIFYSIYFSPISSLLLFSFSFFLVYPRRYPQILLKNQNLWQNSL
jgi:hypothetical protein